MVLTRAFIYFDILQPNLRLRFIVFMLCTWMIVRECGLQKAFALYISRHSYISSWMSEEKRVEDVNRSKHMCIYVILIQCPTGILTRKKDT